MLEASPQLDSFPTPNGRASCASQLLCTVVAQWWLLRRDTHRSGAQDTSIETNFEWSQNEETNDSLAAILPTALAYMAEEACSNLASLSIPGTVTKRVAQSFWQLQLWQDSVSTVETLSSRVNAGC